MKLLRDAYILAKKDCDILGGSIRDYWNMSLRRCINNTYY